MKEEWLTDRAIAFVLLASVAAVYWRTTVLGFVGIDDGQFLDEPHIRSGLTSGGIVWAFSHFHASYYIPVNWISHMADFSIFGLNPAGHHIINVILHGINVLLLFLLFLRTTGQRWESGFVALLFAVHPVHVESVAWVTERKDVLSLFFGLLSFHAYVEYARGRGMPFYVSGLILLALGLLVKPILVVWPVLFLLFDWWPLRRLGGRRDLRRLLAEKIPFFVLAGVSAGLTYMAHHQSGALVSPETLSFSLRVQNAIISVAIYIKNAVWPDHLAVFYPHLRDTMDLAGLLVGGVILLALSVAALLFRNRHPYALFGWLWFLVALVPVSGVVQAGWQAMADRFAYVPYIGLYLGTVWLAADVTRAFPRVRVPAAACALIVAALFAVQARAQTLYWSDRETLLAHAIAVTSGNYFAHLNMAEIEEQRGRKEEAAFHYMKAVEANPRFVASSHTRKGSLLARSGNFSEALSYFERAVSVCPNYAFAWQNYGVTLAMMGRYAEAEEKIRHALSLKPGWPAAEKNLASIRKAAKTFVKPATN
jgi:hypothetical protein